MRVGLAKSFSRGALPMTVFALLVFIMTSVVLGYYGIRKALPSAHASLEAAFWQTLVGTAGATIAFLGIWVAGAMVLGFGAPRRVEEAERRRRRSLGIAAAIGPVGYLAYVLIRVTRGETFTGGLMPIVGGMLTGLLTWMMAEWLIRHFRGTWLPDHFTDERNSDWWRSIPHGRLIYGLCLVFVAADLLFLEVLSWPPLDAPPSTRDAASTLALFALPSLCVGLSLAVWLFNRPKWLVPSAFRDDPGALHALRRGLRGLHANNRPQRRPDS